MRIHGKSWRIAAILLNLGLAGVALAQAPQSQGTEVPDGAAWGASREHSIVERLAQLHAGLKLAPAQEADWKTFADGVERARTARAHPDFEALRKLPAPDRLQRLIDLGKERQATMEQVLALTKTFYATLNPEQRKAFDDLTPLGERAPRGRHGGPARPEAPK